jgi:DNA-binding IclR family transcriptional regulator
VREVKSAVRTIEVLELLAARENEPVRIRELCEAMTAPRSSVYALLRTLTDLGWVRTDASRSLYGIGIRALLAGTTYLDTDPLLRLVKPLLEDLGRRIGETVHYGRLDGADIVYLATEDRRTWSRVGRRLPAYATSLGKAVLSHYDPDQLQNHLPGELMALTPQTIVETDALLEDLHSSRLRGFAVDDEENTPGLRCFGVAVAFNGVALDATVLDNTVTDALSCSVPLERLTDERERNLVAELKSCAQLIGRLATDLAVSSGASYAASSGVSSSSSSR